MLTFAAAPDQGGQVGYGLGIERRLFPGGVEAIGHLGGAGTYTAYVARLHPHGETIALALNWNDNPNAATHPSNTGARGHASVRFDEQETAEPVPREKSPPIWCYGQRSFLAVCEAVPFPAAGPRPVRDEALAGPDAA